MGESLKVVSAGVYNIKLVRFVNKKQNKMRKTEKNKNLVTF